MKFSDSFLDDIRGRLLVSQVVARRVALKRRGREFVGLSPFNKEKTPSFTVNDQKGFYHCFSSGEHGDIFGFVMATEGLSFPEAVERLAGEAGVPLPKPDPAYERAARERLSLLDATEAAAQVFEEELKGRAGEAARAYAEHRGLTEATIQEFRIGYAPGTRDVLKAALIKKGFDESQLIEAGLLIKPDAGRAPYDRFRNRLVIPITDVKGRVIAFGARALDGGEPKYLNSPETRLFDKGSTVFNFARARGDAFDKGELIVVEGYLDVIALHQAGFKNVIATLGTAFTERQMDRLWQLAAEPVLCFDGDRAGEAAAARAIDRMLPVLREGRSFRFAFLPEGLDPDDLVRSEGPRAFSECLKAARPLIDVLWLRETSSQAIDTPERRAALEERLERLLSEIANKRVGDHYRREVKNRLWALWREQGSARFRPQGRPGAQGTGGQGRLGVQGKPPVMETRSGGASLPSARGFASTIVLALAHHPWLLDRFGEEIAGIDFNNAAFAGLLGFMTRTLHDHPDATREEVSAAVAASPHAKLMQRLERDSAFKRLAFLQADTEASLVEEHFRALLFRWQALPTLRKEIDERADRVADASESEFEQFATLQQQLANEGSHHAQDDAGDHDSIKQFQETIARIRGERGSPMPGKRV
jgi:DNA primase